MSALLEENHEITQITRSEELRFPAVASAVLLDCQPLVLETLVRVLESVRVSVASTHTNPRAALAAIAEHRPDVLLLGLDVTEGDLDGLACIRKAQALVPTIKSIVLVDIAQEARVHDAIAAGASAAVLRSAHPADLAMAVRQTLRRSVYLPHPTSFGESGAAVESLAAARAELTKREREILQLVAEGHSNGRVARTLWVTEQTVKFHLSNIYRKLDVRNRTEASRWAQVNGLLPARPERESG